MSWEDDEDWDNPSNLVLPPPPLQKTWEDEEDLEGWDDEPEEKTPEQVDNVAAPEESRENWREKKPWAEKKEAPKIVAQPKPVPPPQQAPKPKKVPKSIAKREMALKEELENQKEVVAPLTSQDIHKLKKEGEERAKAADLINAKDLFDGVGEVVSVGVKYLSEKEKNDQLLRNFEPKTDKDFLILAKAIATRMDKYTNSPFYKYFIKELAKQMMEPLTIDDLNIVVNGLNALINDKVKSTKAKKKEKR